MSRKNRTPKTPKPQQTHDPVNQLDEFDQSHGPDAPPVAEPWTDEPEAAADAPATEAEAPADPVTVQGGEQAPAPDATDPTPASNATPTDEPTEPPASDPADPNDPVALLKGELEALQARAVTLGEGMVAKKLDLAIRAARQALKLKAAAAKAAARATKAAARPTPAELVAQMQAQGMTAEQIVAALAARP